MSLLGFAYKIMGEGFLIGVWMIPDKGINKKSHISTPKAAEYLFCQSPTPYSTFSIL